MINPEDQIPVDDSQYDDAQDQRSQQDVHSNGIEPTGDVGEEEANIDQLNQAYEAAEPSYTLKLDDEPQEKPDQD